MTTNKSNHDTDNLMDCKAFQKELPDLVLTPNALPSAGAAAHLNSCAPCAEDYVSFQQTLGALDQWVPVEPSPFFDTRLPARLREEQATPAMGWFERLQSRLMFNTGRSFRPALAGALGLALAVGGGSFIGIVHTSAPQPQASATINDLQIFDRNEDALKQLDELQQDADNDDAQPAGSVDQPATPIS